MRTRLALSLLALTLVSSCKKDPAWATRPAIAVAGDPTVAGEPAMIPHLVGATPMIDGKLDDAAWASAGVLAPFVDPGNGRDVGEHPVAAWAKLMWDENAVYVGIVIRDRAPTSPFKRSDGDPHVWGKSSGIEMILQPGDPGDNRDYYELQVDVEGAVFDSHFDDYNAPTAGTGPARTFGHQEWSSSVERASFVQVGSFYTVEFKVPWSALAPGRVAIPPHGGDVWRLNLYTFRDGQRLALAWSPIRGQGNFHRATRFGRIRFAATP